MKKFLILIAALVLYGASPAYAGAIQYIGNDKGEPKVKITYSRTNGVSWENKVIKPGQTFNVPKDATHLKIDNAPHNPNRNYKIKDGNVFWFYANFW